MRKDFAILMKCGNCRFEHLKRDEGICADCCGCSEWKPKKK